MAAPKFYEGQEFVSDDPAKPTLVYRAGKFFPKMDQPGGALVAGDEPVAPLTPGSDSRTRVVLGLGPSIEAQKQMYRSEGWNTNPNDPSGFRGGSNPLNRHPIAANLAMSAENGKPAFLGIDKQSIAKTIGGDDYQAYDQAAKSWESAMLPILSGAAVTPTEAQRQIRANLPQLGDTPKTLSSKSKNRAMMTNAAADLAGRPRPFPKIGTWDFRGEGGSGGAPAPAAPAAPGRPPLSSFHR